MQNKNISSMFRSRSRAIALEPRLLFDGAGAVAAVDGMDDFDFDDQHNDGLVEDVHEAGSEQQSIVNDGDAIEIIDGDDSLHIPSSLGSRLGLEVEQENILAGTEEKNLLIIDSRVDNHELLLESVGSSVTVVVVGEGESGLDAISNALAGSNGYDAIHIISHGTPGSFTLGTDQVDSTTIQHNSAQLQGWAEHLNAGADILLYGCDVAQGETGQSFIDQLAAITGADIAASTNPTGNAEQGGDWVLESETGPIEADVFEIEGYAGLLDGSADITVKDTLGSKGVSTTEDATGDFYVGQDFDIKGSSDSYSVTISVGEGGKLVSGSENGTEITFEDLNLNDLTGLLDGLKYTYEGDSEIGFQDTLTITITDTNQGTTTVTRSINVTPENDAPTMDGSNVPDELSEQVNLEVKEGGTVSFKKYTPLYNGKDGAELGAWHENLGLYDPDNTAEQIIIKITEMPDQGSLYLNGVLLAEGAILSLDQIDQLKYQHDGTQVTDSDAKDTFKITVDDGAGGLITGQEVEVNLKPVNQNPSVEGGITVIQGEGKVNLGTGGSLPVVGGVRGQLSGMDAEGENLSYEIISLPGVGKLYYGEEGSEVEITDANKDIVEDLELLWYEYPADLEPTDSSVNGKVTFEIKVKDQGGGQRDADDKPVIGEKIEEITIVVLDNNNDPFFAGEDGNKPIDIENLPPVDDTDNTKVIDSIDFDTTDKDSGTSHVITITPDMLPLADADSSEGARVYTIVGSNADTSGYFTVNGKLLSVNGNDYATFTQADVEAGNVKYHLFSTNSEARIDYIDFTVKDGAKTIVFDQDNPDDSYVRDGGIYAVDTKDSQELQKFRLQVEVPASASGGVGGDLPDLPERATGITISGNNTLELKESGEVKLPKTLKADDGINSPPEQIVYRIDKAPTHGSLWRDGTELKLHDSFTQADINSGAVKYVHNGSENFTDSFNFSVSNGDFTTANAANKFSFDITPQNDSPTANGKDVVVGEGGAVYIEITLADPDKVGNKDQGQYNKENSVGYRIDSLPGNGWLYLVPAETNIGSLSPDASGNLSIGGNSYNPITAGAVFTASDLAGKKLIYIHNGTENHGDTSLKITPIDDVGVAIKSDGTTDNTVNADDTNQSSAGAQETITITVTPRNDAPIFVGKSEPTGDKKIYEGEELTIGGKDTDKYHLIYSDSDNSGTQRQYRVTEAPQYGTLTRDGVVLSVGSVFTQKDLDEGLIKYTHDGSENHADSFDYVVSDGDWTSNEDSKNATDTKPVNSDSGIFKQGDAATSSRYKIEIAPTNDAPEINRKPAADANGKQYIVVDSTDASKASSLGGFNITDPDLDGEGVDKTAEGYSEQVRVTVDFPEALEPVFDGVTDWSNPNLGDGVSLVSHSDGKLVVEGNRDNIQGFLNSLKVKIAEGQDPNKRLTIKVTVDDRIYDASGNVIGANGGDKNDIDGTPTDIPGASESNPASNTHTIEIEVWASATNDTPKINNAPEAVVINEDGWNGSTYNNDGRTKLELGTIAVVDADAFDTDNNKLTICVEQGKLYFSQAGSGLPAGVTLADGAVGDSSMTLKGTKDALEAALKSIYYKSATEHFNGMDKLTVKFDDDGNVGQDEKNGETPDSSVSVNIDIHIVPVNDAPVLGNIKEADESGAAGAVIDENNKYITLTDEYEFSANKGNAITFTDPDRKPDDGVFDDDTGHQYAADDAKYTITIKANIEGETDGFGTIQFKGGTNTDGITITTESGELVITGTYDALHAALAAGIIYTPGADGGEDENIQFSITVGDDGDGGTKITDTNTQGGGLVGNLDDTFSFFFQRTDANDAPIFVLGGQDESDAGSNILNNGPTFAAGDVIEERKPVVLDPEAKVTDEELDLFSQNGGNWADAVLTVERGDKDNGPNEFESSPNAGDEFGFTNAVTVNGSDIKIGNKTVGEIIKNTGGTLQIRFTDQAESEDVNIVLKSITYKNTETSDALNEYGESASVDIIYSMRDGNSNTDPTDGEDTTGGDGQNQGTGGELTGYGKITVDINRQVIAKDDSAVVTEPGARDDVPSDADNGKVTGDLTPGADKNNDSTEKQQDHDPDTDDTITVIEVSQGGETGTVGTDGEITIDGQYGTLVVQPDGSYTYTVDPENLKVQGLLPGEKLEDEIFDYKVSDTQGDKVNGYDPNTYADAQLTITINGSNDTVTVDVTPPTDLTDKIDGDDPTKPKNKQPEDHIVFESGLEGGTNFGVDGAEDSIKVDSSFTIEALDGLDEDKALTITVGSITTDITKAELVDLGTTSKLIDAEYGTLTLKGYSQDANGKITIAYEYELTGKATHDPTVNNGNVFDEITIKVTDRGGNTGADSSPKSGEGIEGGKDTNTQTIRIQVVDDAPVTENDSNSVRSGETVNWDTDTNVLKNDKEGADGWHEDGAVSEIKHGTEAAKSVTADGTKIQGEHGTLTIKPDGSYSYTANPDTPEGSKDTFTYTVKDADGNTQTAELSITISKSGLALDPGTGNVEEKHLSNGSDPQQGGATVTDHLPLKSGKFDLKDHALVYKESDLKYGTVTIDPDTGEYTYTLTESVDHKGGTVTDTFTYTAQDEYGNTVENTVTITIVDDKPTAVNDVIDLGNKQNTYGSVIGGNSESGQGKDTVGADGATVTGVVKGSQTDDVTDGVKSDIKGEYGILVLQPDGSYNYTRNETVVDGDATDTFTYTITDTDGDTSTATITINIGNKIPSDPVVATPGEVDEAGLPTGSNPGTGNKVTGEITFTPGDGDHEDHKYEITKNPGFGEAVITGSTPNADGTVTITYEYTLTTPTNKGSDPEDKFTVTITDEDGDKVDTEVTVTIKNDTPTAENDTNEVVQGQTTRGNVITNDKSGADDWDKDGPVTGIKGETNSTVTSDGDGWKVETDKGTLTIQPDGSYTYNANPGVGGNEDVFTYTVRDADGDESTATLTITISDNTPPIAINDFAETDEDTPVSGNLLTNDKDPDGNPITVTEITVGGTTTKVPTDGSNITITVPGKGSITVNKNGGYTFTPNPGVIGKIPDIGYKITDGNGGDDTAKLSINVKPGNPPVAPPVTNIPDDGRHSPLGGTPEITRVKGLTDSAVITDPSVFYEGERHDDVRRLPIPLQPIVYVNNEVAAAQQQRHADDMRADSSPAHIQPFAGQSISLAMGLGQDRNLFVSHAVRDTQQTAATLDSRVAGRLSRVDLSADDMLASNDLRSMQFAQVDADETEKAKQKRQQAAQSEDNEGREDEVALQEFEADDADIFAEQQSVMPVAASFTEQLRGTSKHLPFAAREKNFLI